MKIFYATIKQLQQFTMELNAQSIPLACQNCNKVNTLVSHGFIYIKQQNNDKVAIGKRIFCSNRYGKPGCGHTIQLYLSSRIPKLHYSCSQLSAFISALVNGSTIKQAYQKVTSRNECHNAYRWLTKLSRQLPTFRSLPRKMPEPQDDRYCTRSRCLQLLLPTLHTLFECPLHAICSHYQITHQQAFI